MRRQPNIQKVIYELEMWGLGGIVNQIMADSLKQSEEVKFLVPIVQRVERRLRHLRQRFPIFKISRPDNLKLVISPIKQVAW